MKLTTRTFSWICASLIALQALAWPAFGQSVTQTLLTDPNLAGCSSQSLSSGSCSVHGTKLTAHDSIVIEAPVAMSLANNPPGTPICYSINNNTDNSFFVPWNTTHEWSSFLTAIGAPYQLGMLFGATPIPADNRWIDNVFIGACCPEQQVGQICVGVNGPIVSTAELGYRYKGTLAGDIPHWAAQSDVYGPVYASAVNGDPNLTYRVTFVCSNGSWVKTHEEGSCVPVDGQCANGAAGITALPNDLTTLCAPTSIFAGFTNPGGASSPGPWTWTCLGTAGMASAICSAGAIDGACGSANGVATATSPATGGLCANGTTPSPVTMTMSSPPYYQWTCGGINGSTASASCAAPFLGGLCNGGQNPAIPAMDGSSGTSPPAGTLCLSGTPTIPVLSPTVGSNNLPLNDGTLSWRWQCLDPNGQCNYGSNLGNGFTGNCACERLDLSSPQVGQCGAANGTVDISSTVPPPSGNLCGPNNTLASGPTFILGTPSTWTWSCQGNNAGSTASCSSIYDLNPGACGPANNQILATPPSDPAQLCQGMPTAPYNNGNTWYWSCTGAAGDRAQCSARMNSNAQCGAANGVPSIALPTALCAAGNASAVSNSNGSWSWQCTDPANGTTMNCSAPASNNAPNASCGSANGAPSGVPPSAGLCGAGSFATNITTSAGQWLWTCQSGSGSIACAAPISGSGPGICGSANNTSIPDQPNFNLCASGAATAVTGSGPWTWTCVGQGPNAGQDDNCSANVCQACSASVTLNVTGPQSIGTIMPSGCTVRGLVSWTETDAITPSNSPVQLQWIDPFDGTFAKTFNAVPASSTYCPPCYKNLQSVSNAQVTVQAVAGSCPADVALNSGNPVSYPAANVTVTP
jgi:hypothetical protein